MAANENLYAILREQFPADLDTVAVETDDGLRYSWRDLDRSSAMIANLFVGLGLEPGARVAVQVDKSVEAMSLYLATLRAGLVFLPLNTAYQSAELTYFLGDAEPAVVVCSPKNFGWVSKLAFSGTATWGGSKAVYTLGDDRTGSLLDRATNCSDIHRVNINTSGDQAAILYTSGTTGRSKGAMLSHGNMSSNAVTLKTYWDWQPGDVLIHALPIFHVHGLFVAIHGALINASTMLWCARFDPRTTIALMRRATVFMGVPTLYVRMLQEPSLTAQATRNMRLFIAGSAPLLKETFELWRERTGHTILERYGMSETAMLTSNPCLADARHGNQSQRRAATVGFPLPGVTLRVCGDDGVSLPMGEIGGIEVKGPNVFGGYWRMPEKTAQEFTRDGYFKTGDVGLIDALGYVSIVGRSKDLIISGGYNVYPAEIEAVINDMVGVAESAVIGLPHADFGEVGLALVVVKPGADIQSASVIQHLKSCLANFKVPKRCEIVTELPRNTMGKVQKNLLRDRYGQARQ